jgi:hypothetical protein
MCEERDWANLPTDVINLISKKLPKLTDFVHFLVVCKTWFSSDQPPQLPWFIEDRTGYYPLNPLYHELRLYSFFSGETVTILKKGS